jgi:ATP-dependent helicase/nuclease subunit B
MEPFLKLVVQHIHLRYKDKVEKLCIVLPSKRGAIYLKGYFAEIFKETIWLPDIKSAEEFIEEISGLKQADEIDLLAYLYDSYLACMQSEPDSFEKFSKWGHLMLQDFNEIDRYLVDSKQIYENLKNIKEIESWSLGENELTEAQLNYLAFMASIGTIYTHFQKQLLEKGIGYQGLLYRKASERYKECSVFDTYEQILFCGFNAFNAAETLVYKWLHQSKKAEFLWDADNYYLQNELQEAGVFLRRNLQTFPTASPDFIIDGFKEPKNIVVTAVAGQIGQAQLVHDKLKAIMHAKRDLSKVAVVLANEKLLWPVLKVLPPDIEHVNITLEYPIRFTQAYSFMELILTIQLSYDMPDKKRMALYHKHFTSVLQHAFFGVWLKANHAKPDVHQILSRVREHNMSFITQNTMRDLLKDFPEQVYQLFEPWNNGSQGNEVLQNLTNHIRDYYIELFTNEIIHLEIEYLEVLHKAFNRLSDILNKYAHYQNLKAYRQLFIQTVGSASVPFIGEPLRGLQIMGVLETRTLDFEEVIMVGVNEGVLPSGKSINSFLPNDLKRVFGLPLYYEKDAIYAYHFYRLLQRSKRVHLIYDSETDEMGKGEKSRFISQLQFELSKYQPLHVITENVAISSNPIFEETDIVIPKTEITLREILERAVRHGEFGGLSPSALITFKDCSLRYYFRYGAGLKELKEVEENAEAGTFGTILHKALELLYTPFLNKPLKAEDMKAIQQKVDETVEAAFKEELKEAGNQKGKSLLQLEVLKVYARKQTERDERLVEELSKSNRYLTIMHLEKEWQAPLSVEINGEMHNLTIKGKIDRIDKCGEKIRIIDYKSSVKSNDKFRFTHYHELFTDSDYNKQFQLFCYVWLLRNNMPEYLSQAEPGIIAFKKYEDEPKVISRTLGKKAEPMVFNEEDMEAFELVLKEFVASIFNRDKVFTQTNDLEKCKYCDYRGICNR